MTSDWRKDAWKVAECGRREPPHPRLSKRRYERLIAVGTPYEGKWWFRRCLDCGAYVDPVREPVIAPP